MKTTLSHLSQEKQDELKRIVQALESVRVDRKYCIEFYSSTQGRLFYYNMFYYRVK